MAAPGRRPTAGNAPSGQTTKRKRAQNGSHDGTDNILFSQSTQNGQPRAVRLNSSPIVIDLAAEPSSSTAPKTPPSSRKKRKITSSPIANVQQEERRLRLFRNHPSQMFLQKLDRARTQRYAFQIHKHNAPSVVLSVLCLTNLSVHQ